MHKYKILSFNKNAWFKIYIRDQNTGKIFVIDSNSVRIVIYALNQHPSKDVLMIPVWQTTLYTVAGTCRSYTVCIIYCHTLQCFC